MDRQAFNTKIEAHNINRGLFTFAAPNDCMYALRPNGDGYEVYYFERGLKSDARVFAHEAEALDYLFDLLCKDSRARST